MTNRLQKILIQKQREVAQLYSRIEQDTRDPIRRLLMDGRAPASANRFQSILARPRLSVIAEIKRRSPSKGVLAAISDPLSLANDYLNGGADAISVLTDEVFFGGSLDDLQQVSRLLKGRPQAVLCKDFIIDPIQIAQAVIAGADAVLGIVAALQHRTKELVAAAKRMDIAILLEVHNEDEIEVALQSGAAIIGVNNRNLSNFEIDTSLALRLVEHIPADIIRVAESGIVQAQQAQQYAAAGFNAVLIGEALVTSTDPSHFIRACNGH